jgi:serine/threonine-protein kinase SRPK3
LKVFVSKHRQAQNEEKIYKHLRSIKTSHLGEEGIRFLLDHFQLPGKLGLHECLVHKPLGLTLKDIREMSEGEKVSGELLKPIIECLLMALDFLHTEARVVHTAKSTQLTSQIAMY